MSYFLAILASLDFFLFSGKIHNNRLFAIIHKYSMIIILLKLRKFQMGIPQNLFKIQVGQKGKQKFEGDITLNNFFLTN